MTLMTGRKSFERRDSRICGKRTIRRMSEGVMVKVEKRIILNQGVPRKEGTRRKEE